MWGILAAWTGCANHPKPIAPMVADECSTPTNDGGELFARVWVPADPRAPTGDGLGPVSNGRSCVECHNQGGPGGAGGAHTNVELLRDAPARRPTGLGSMLLKIGYFDGPFPTSRNTPALWGSGQLDTITDAELVAVSLIGDRDHPEISGRVARDSSGNVARFGWKGQTATLAAFVENACANELGLETATVSQPGEPAPGPDLSDAALDALVSEVASFPAPIEVPTPGADAGKALFGAIGCTACHRETLGDVRGIYADLLLHDLGEELTDEQLGYGRLPSKPVAGTTPAPREWRTPPLWGLRDSGPYLHDGRASDVDAAIRSHDGEAAAIRDAYRDLSPSDRELVQRFLATLAAPTGRSG